jgi:hypothetical protein
LKLDFVFFHMMNSKRQGMATRKFFLDRLAPAFYAPRIESLISFEDFYLRGGDLFLPLGQENWNIMEDKRQKQVMKRGERMLADYSLQYMAVDRRLKSLLASSEGNRLCFGDEFIKALAVVLSREMISRHCIQRIVVVGMVDGMEDLLKYLAQFGTPITVQNSQPARYEIMAYRLLYEKGLAVSNSQILPRQWARGDLILSFEPGYYQFVIAAPGIFFFGLDNESDGWAPSLAQIVDAAGLETGLNTLAPIFETCLYTKAGFNNFSREIGIFEKSLRMDRLFERLIAAGDELGLWEPFLDKVI